MGDTFLRHLITTIATVVLALVYWAGFTSGVFGWWWTFIGIIILYPLIYKLVNA